MTFTPVWAKFERMDKRFDFVGYVLRETRRARRERLFDRAVEGWNFIFFVIVGVSLLWFLGSAAVSWLRSIF